MGDKTHENSLGTDSFLIELILIEFEIVFSDLLEKFIIERSVNIKKW